MKSDLQKAIALCRSSFASAGFFSLFINFLMLVPALYMLQLYDRVVTSGSEATLVMLTLMMVLLMATMGGLEWVRSQMMVRVSVRLEKLLNKRVFGLAFKQALYVGSKRSPSQPLDDLSGLRQFLTGNGLFAFFYAPWMPIYIAVMFMFHEWFGWMAVGTVIILTILTFINEKLTAETLKEANDNSMVGRALVQKNLRNAEVVESMGMLAGIRKRWLDSVNEVLFLQSKASSRAASLTSLSKTIRILSQSLILGLGGYLVIQQQITPGLMIAGSILLGRALAPIDMMIGSWKSFVAARGQYARLNEALLAVPEEKEKMTLPAPEGELWVDQILVAPPGSTEPVLAGINFSLKPGESLAIVGPSAAGKSTLARVILGIWPVLRGKVRIDSVDVFSWNREELGPYIGYLPQDIELFEGSIAENISRFGEMDSDMIVAAAKLSDVHEMILSLPEGYDTVIGHSGGVLSGGQRQRIGLARAVYGEPKLILLDEPNSNLDEVGEQALAKAIVALKQKNITVIVISHRTGIVEVLDKMLVLKGGEMVAFGPRDEVLNKLQQKHSSAVAPKNTNSVGRSLTVTPSA